MPPRPRSTGRPTTFPTDERHHPYNNRTLYGAAKLMDEGIARSFHDMDGLPSVGLRYFNVYGPRMDVTGAYTEVFVRWLDCIEQGRPPQIHGDGSASMDFIYVEDVARANILAMRVGPRGRRLQRRQRDRDDAPGPLAGDAGTRPGADHLEPEFHPARKVNPVPRRLADTRRAREELGFVAEVPLEAGLRRLVAVAARHGRWARRSLRLMSTSPSEDPDRPPDPGRGGGRGGPAGDPLGMDHPGARGRGVRGGVRRATSGPPTPAPSRTARRPCTWPCTPWASGPATRSSPSATRSSPPPTPSATAGPARSSWTSTRGPTTSTRR